MFLLSDLKGKIIRLERDHSLLALTTLQKRKIKREIAVLKQQCKYAEGVLSDEKRYNEEVSKKLAELADVSMIDK